MFDHLLESSRQDIGFGEEIGIIEMEICTLSGALCDQRLQLRASEQNSFQDYFIISSFFVLSITLVCNVLKNLSC